MHVRYKAITFSFDGTIADSRRIASQALVETMAEAGIEIALEDALRIYAGKRWSAILALIEARIGRELPPPLIRQKFKEMGRRVAMQVNTIPGVEAFLNITKNTEQIIVAASEPVWISQTLTRFGLKHYFSNKIYTTARLKHDKPNPHIYQHIAKNHGLAPHEILAIEDDAAGVMAAVAAGVTVIGLLAGSHIVAGVAEEMQAAGAHHLAADYESVDDWIKRPVYG